jgi:hypothetical protein
MLGGNRTIIPAFNGIGVWIEHQLKVQPVGILQSDHLFAKPGEWVFNFDIMFVKMFKPKLLGISWN